MYCSNCGNKLGEQSKFCTACGSPVERVEGVNVSSEPIQEQPEQAEVITIETTQPRPQAEQAVNAEKVYVQPRTKRTINVEKAQTQSVQQGLAGQVSQGNKNGKIYQIAGWVSMVVSLLFYPIIFGAVAVIMGYLYRETDEKQGTIIMIAGVAGGIFGMVFGMATSGWWY